MPGPTKLDKLVEQLRGFAKPKADIIQETTIRDPLSYPLEQRHPFGRKPGEFQIMDITPERQKYQRGIEARLYPKKVAADEMLDEANSNRDMIQDEWNDAISDAKESMRDDWESGLDYQAFEDVDPNYLEVDAPTTDLREYWPSYARSPEEIGESFESAQDAYYDAKDAQKRIYSTRGIMDEQAMTPRYRRYQRAMADRAANRRLGHQIARYKAEVQRNQIMRLRQMGYSPAQIRAMMTGQYPMPMGGR